MAQEVRVTILVAEGFVPTELALVQDILRIATRLGQNLSFVLQVCSLSGEDLVEGLGGLLVRTTPFKIDETTLPDHLVVLGGKGARHGFVQLRARLRWFERMGRNIILLSDAASEWQRLHPDTERLTTHWELQQLDRDAEFAPEHELPLFSLTSRITTAAGMLSTADVVLTRIVAPLSRRLSQAVGQVLLMEHIREGDVSQPRSENDVASLRLVQLEDAVAAMEQNVEVPLSMKEIAAVAGFSVRQLERKFKFAVGQSPAAFYRSLRLRRARNLIEQTSLSLFEISVACGLGNQTNFARNYTREFGISPARRRTELSAVVKHNQLSSQSQGTQHAPLPISPRPPRPSLHSAGADEAAVRGA